MTFRTSVPLTEEIAERINALGQIGRTENGGVTRLLYSDSWLSAQTAVKKTMEEMGFSTHFDDVGNVFGRVEGTEERDRVILTGSHIDTVVDGGKYDGAFGVLAAMIAVSRLKQEYGAPKKTIETVALCEEEGSRFHLAFWGSGSITGRYQLNDARTVTDGQGTTLEDAMHQMGFGQGKYPPARREDIACFLETHIEQGQILEREHLAWAPVSHIVGMKRIIIRLSGQSNHAGTTPMADRRDALYAASQMIFDVVSHAKEQSNGLVATVGQISIRPNVGNVIPGDCTFALDVRHHEYDVLHDFCTKELENFRRIAEKAAVELDIKTWLDDAPVKMDPSMTERHGKIAQRAGVPFKKMVSGAGHDSQIFGVYCPTAMMFVPSHDGISHSPKEFTRIDDLATGVRMLMKILHEMAY
ncbi:allantoate deiminase [Sporolactobacillus shoreicorticis]|uniref:Allantoate deiminase n=1 Tax=Sporolactobacillus shoreicorticis TaxID=1923877 RepID=A0ABW5S7I3_9BACL|nr:allantoate deiminase [Sporolactobacillus shoreicorticis]MCO7126942.1 allantoate deiminase [Sporolactobacillus shoreicorticis]